MGSPKKKNSAIQSVNLLTLMLMEGQVNFRSQQNISGATQQSSLLNRWGLVFKASANNMKTTTQMALYSSSGVIQVTENPQRSQNDL